MSDSKQAVPSLEPLAIDDFAAFYEAIHTKETDEKKRMPFAWQERLAAQVCQGTWPDYIKLPTSSGKTAAIDIAIFALAFQAHKANRPDGVLTAARRIFFVVDRRIIVNEAYLQTRQTAMKLWKAITSGNSDEFPPILYRVASWLHRLAGGGNAPPLDCFELRGGIYRDDAWIRSPLQPTVLTSTVDQVGSRLLFRGYGVSDRCLPIHAALTANDSLIILDEAHCSNPFSQTVKSIARFRGKHWAAEPIAAPFALVQMTATPPEDLDNQALFTLDTDDYKTDSLLELRHGCTKPVELVHASSAKGKLLPAKLARKLVEKANELASEYECKRIAIVVNRVAIARATFDLLNAKHPGDTSLMIGRMRPIDRDDLTTELQKKFASGSEATFEHPQFVVATQCVEVGADFDFDGLVSQCASLDAMRQRYGRLNRLGTASHSRGVIVAAEGDLQPLDKLNDDKPLDPIYGNALARTWHWLLGQANKNGEVDFGIKELDTRCEPLAKEIKKSLASPAPDAPVLMPAHVDMLCQTSPRPTPEPDIASFLHGLDRGMPEVRVCWRADLDMSKAITKAKRKQNWLQAVEVCPPSSAECLSVPVHLFKRWLRGEKIIDLTSDVLGEQVEEESKTRESDRLDSGRSALVWRGKRKSKSQQPVGKRKRGRETDCSFCIDESSIRRIQANATIVIPVEFGGWHDFGYLPNAPDEPDDERSRLQDTVTAKGVTQATDESSENDLAKIDVADRAFQQSRARTILRVHPKLSVDDSASTLFKEMLAVLNDTEADLRVMHWKDRIGELIEETDDNRQRSSNRDNNGLWKDSRLQLLKRTSGTIIRYPDGIAWTTGLHPDRATGMPLLPLAFFGDDHDSLSETERVSLFQHLDNVHHEASRLVDGIALPAALRETITTAARLHDVGKADPRFQAMLLGKPVSIAFMQSKLWAKSGFRGVAQPSELPAGFRHEMLSLDLLDRFDKGNQCNLELLAHAVASHHGYARPLAPICVDASPPGFNLDSFGIDPVSQEERQRWHPAHQLDSGVAERFWGLNRRFGWWGLAYLETILRLSDWTASATPRQGDVSIIEFARSTAIPPTRNGDENHPSIILDGIDGSNPLAFLAAIGLFRTLASGADQQQYQFAWTQHDGAWRPVVYQQGDLAIDEDAILDLLLERLHIDPDDHPALRLSELEGNRRNAFERIASTSVWCQREDADWLSCNGSDAANAKSISQLQTTRRDYHAINVRGLLTETNREHLERTLFEPWDYKDPIAGVSLHLEPREDRRHAYQWYTPSGDPTRKSYGGMIGANRLALEAWPLFQSLPFGDRLITVGFRGTRVSDTRLTWPIWSHPVPGSVLPTLLAYQPLQPDAIETQLLEPLGITCIYRCHRILVGKTPNLTPSVAVLA
jgi:CRISPR-associated endonuclease/helicase Cas3